APVTVILANGETTIDLRQRIFDVAASLRGDWRIDIQPISLGGIHATIIDEAAAKPVKLNVSDITLTTQPVSSQSDYRAQAMLTAAVNGGGRVRLDVDAMPLDMTGSITLKGETFDLAVLDAYRPRELLAAGLTSGKVSFD